jgi:nitroreductase
MIDREMIVTWLEVASLAPSPHNNQPWVARVAPDGIILRLDDQLLPLLGPDRVQFIALGAFIENMSFAAAVDGYRLAVDELPTVPRRTSEITVRLRVRAGLAENAAIMLEGAKRRRTNRGRYESILPSGVTEELRAVPCESATSLTLISGAADRSAAADLAARAMHVLFSVPELRRDLAPFVFTSADAPRRIGMPIESLNPAASTNVPGSQWVLELASADEEAEAARVRFEHAPLHFVVSSRTDTLPGWIAGGRTLQRVLVTATVLGLSHCLAAGPSEIPTLLPALRRLVDNREGRPLILGRLGVPSFPEQAIAAPRRPIADFLIGSSELFRACGSRLGDPALMVRKVGGHSGAAGRLCALTLDASLDSCTKQGGR